ncbi:MULTISPECIES: helix-turn-helix transcriptional regulator [Bacillus]|uniref:helix-turn-helix transcriptional regulator n=1 Tax=Bacillus TaxID=1386 RepID=UPI000D02D564|nr:MULTISPECIES: YafY family protein [Bacillus]KAA0840111.1 YafY family transcriptional regulator [Bacillus paralicheniformis]KAA0841236.1 YafY family transcriptional regulator [Bacillus paralicheniformis]MBZ5213195.1 YafY family transcriptional regulator [Bacillus paralicheniformis]MCJ8222985.1 YafY family transcriptional regulator [Bacillus paralicheniformis]MEC4200856.1 YafY family protein [Bacillus sp. AAVF1]
MPKTERLIELMMTVHTKRKFTAGELAAEFGVSYRTILRDLDELSALGVPIYSETGANGGYYLLNEPVLPPLFFTQSEAAAMFFAYQSLQFFGSLPFDAETRMVLKKFYRHLPAETQERIDAMKDRIVFWNPHRPKAAEHLETLLDAAINQSVLTVVYDGTDDCAERSIQPIGLFSWNGFWYCPAYCFKRQAFRLFRADRILRAEKAASPLARQLPYPSVLSWIKHSESECPEPVRLQAELTRRGARRAAADVDLFKILTMRDDGTGAIDANLPRPELEYFGELLWNLGTEATVKEPAEIKLQLKRKAADILARYD